MGKLDHLFTETRVVTTEVPAWTEDEWGQLDLGDVREVCKVHTEMIRQRHRETSPRYVVQEARVMRGIRGSGKRYSYREVLRSKTYRRTKSGLVIAQDFEPAKNLHTSAHLFSDESLARRRPWTPKAQATDMDALYSVIGELPDVRERFPLFDEVDLQGLATGQSRAWSVHQHYLDAQNYAEVAKSMYGAKHYRKPLAGFMDSASTGAHGVLSAFRGLVPIDWIIDAYRAQPQFDQDWAQRQIYDNLRLLLRHVDETARRRFLREIHRDYRRFDRGLWDLVRGHQQRLRAALALDGLGRVRSTEELHDLVYQRIFALEADGRESAAAKRKKRRQAAQRRLQREGREARALAAERARTGTDISWNVWMETAQQREAEREARRAIEQAEREQRRERERTEREKRFLAEREAEIAWARTLKPTIAKAKTAHYRFVVAKDSATLAHWSQQMHNCIADYARHLENRVLMAVTEEDTVIACAEIRKDEGVVQLLGRRNRDLPVEVFDEIVEGLIACGAKLNPDCWGAPDERAREDARRELVAA